MLGLRFQNNFGEQKKTFEIEFDFWMEVTYFYRIYFIIHNVFTAINNTYS